MFFVYFWGVNRPRQEAQASCEVDEKEAGEAAATATAIKNDCQKELDEARQKNELWSGD